MPITITPIRDFVSGIKQIFTVDTLKLVGVGALWTYATETLSTALANWLKLTDWKLAAFKGIGRIVSAALGGFIGYTATKDPYVTAGMFASPLIVLGVGLLNQIIGMTPEEAAKALSMRLGALSGFVGTKVSKFTSPVSSGSTSKSLLP